MTPVRQFDLMWAPRPEVVGPSEYDQMLRTVVESIHQVFALSATKDEMNAAEWIITSNKIAAETKWRRANGQ